MKWSSGLYLIRGWIVAGQIQSVDEQLFVTRDAQ